MVLVGHLVAAKVETNQSIGCWSVGPSHLCLRFGTDEVFAWMNGKEKDKHTGPSLSLSLCMCAARHSFLLMPMPYTS